MRSARRKCNVARGTGRRMPTVWFGCMRSCVCTYGIVSRRTMCRETGANSHTSCTYYCIVQYTTHAQCNAPPQTPPTHLDARAGLPLFGGPPAVVVSRADLQQHQQQTRWSTRLPCNTHHQRPTANSHHHHHHHQPTARLTLSPPRGSTLQKALPRHAPPQAQRQDGRPAWTEQPSTAAPAAGPSQPARRT